MVTIDNIANINRIIEILENNTTLKQTVREFKFGEDDGNIHDRSPPYILVTTPNRPIITRDQFGIGEGSSDPSSLVQYVIKVFVLGDDSENAETQLYDIIKQVVDILKANPRLKNPDTDDDPRCIRSVILSVESDANNRGKEDQNATISIQCQVGSAFSATLPGGLILELLSIPNSTEGFDFHEVFTDAQKRKAMPSTEKGIILLEYENTSSNESAVRALLGTTNDITLTKNGNGRTIRVAFVDVNPTPRFDEIERAILHLEITN